MIGCDGGRSQVRKSMNVEFSGFTYEERFLILSDEGDLSSLVAKGNGYDAWIAQFGARRL